MRSVVHHGLTAPSGNSANTLPRWRITSRTGFPLNLTSASTCTPSSPSTDTATTSARPAGICVNATKAAPAPTTAEAATIMDFFGVIPTPLYPPPPTLSSLPHAPLFYRKQPLDLFWLDDKG